MLLTYLTIMFLVACLQGIDVCYSERGFASGLWEGNGLIVRIFGKRPTTVQLYSYNLVALLLCALPGFFSHDLKALSIGCFVGLGARHLQAILRWRKLV